MEGNVVMIRSDGGKCSNDKVRCREITKREKTVFEIILNIIQQITRTRQTFDLASEALTAFSCNASSSIPSVRSLITLDTSTEPLGFSSIRWKKTLPSVKIKDIYIELLITNSPYTEYLI